MLILILILDQAVIELFLDVREDVQQLHEIIFTDHANRAVILGLNRRRPLRLCQKGNLPEMLPRLQHPYKTFLTFLVLDPALAFALGYDEKVVSGLALLNFNLLGLAHYKLDLGYHIVLDF